MPFEFPFVIYHGQSRKGEKIKQGTGKREKRRKEENETGNFQGFKRNNWRQQLEVVAMGINVGWPRSWNIFHVVECKYEWNNEEALSRTEVILCWLYWCIIGKCWRFQIRENVHWSWSWLSCSSLLYLN